MSIRSARLDALKTQKDVAEHMGVTVETVRRWECGISGPPFRDLKRLADFLGCPVYRMLDEDEARTAESRPYEGAGA